VLLRDRVRAAARFGELAAALELLDFGKPAHLIKRRGSSSARVNAATRPGRRAASKS